MYCGVGVGQDHHVLFSYLGMQNLKGYLNAFS